MGGLSLLFLDVLVVLSDFGSTHVGGGIGSGVMGGRGAFPLVETVLSGGLEDWLLQTGPTLLMNEVLFGTDGGSGIVQMRAGGFTMKAKDAVVMIMILERSC